MQPWVLYGSDLSCVTRLSLACSSYRKALEGGTGLKNGFLACQDVYWSAVRCAILKGASIRLEAETLRLLLVRVASERLRSETLQYFHRGGNVGLALPGIWESRPKVKVYNLCRV